MGKLFNTTTIVSVMVALAVYGMIIAPMLAPKETIAPPVVE